MLIGLDFDNVIADTGEEWEKLSLHTKPVSEGVLDLLNNNVANLIMTGREDLTPVFEWIAAKSPKWKGEIHSAQSHGGRKGPYLALRNVSVFIDDLPEYVEDIRSCGVPALHFIKNLHDCPKKMLEQEGYLHTAFI
ncbi:MAG: hypothetical protein HY754_10980 [Nitrospirae bacterium]|nr:hypothetical protein [Nitrospirota bacterium]